MFGSFGVSFAQFHLLLSCQFFPVITRPFLLMEIDSFFNRSCSCCWFLHSLHKILYAPGFAVISFPHLMQNVLMGCNFLIDSETFFLCSSDTTCELAHEREQKYFSFLSFSLSTTVNSLPHFEQTTVLSCFFP